uniref:Group XV phospholipase A2 n=1 Tax=Clastoptera arizonana TaxID=38151 RepID=A0A1B6CCH8_9HEMI
MNLNLIMANRPISKLILLGFVCVLYFITSNTEAKSFDIIHPIILVPGDGGSQVDAKLNKSSVVHYICEKTTSDYFNIWLNLELLVPLVIDCWVDNMRLEYDNITRTTHNPPGVELRIPGFGDPFSVEWLDPTKVSAGAYFKTIGDALVSLGYERNISLRGAPYDFRKAPNENQDFFVNFKKLIEETYEMNNKSNVILVAHSMGSPMCLQFLQKQTQAWKDEYIRALVTLSGPWGGSVKAIKVFTVGDDLGVYILKESWLRDMQITSPSLAWLLPLKSFWNSSETLIETDTKNYTIDDLQDYFFDIDYPLAWEMWKDVEPYTRDFTAPGVEVHCLHGVGVQTVDRLAYKKGKFPYGYPNFVYGDGDGTVNLRSLEGCLQWKTQQKQPVYHQTFSKMDHMDILSDGRILQYITSLLPKLARNNN